MYQSPKDKGKNGQAKGWGHRSRQGSPRQTGRCDRPEHVQEQDGGGSGRDAGQMAWRSRSSYEPCIKSKCNRKCLGSFKESDLNRFTFLWVFFFNHSIR